MRLDGRVALVTGAGAGLGRAYALVLADMGASVLVNDPGKDKMTGAASAEAVAAEIRAKGGKASPNTDFVTKDMLSAEKIVQAAVDAFGRLDILVNNAGILRDVAFQKQTWEDWSIIQEIHLYGQRNLCKAAWPRFREHGYGRIVNISSINGVRGAFGQTNYSAAKAGVIGLTKALALEGAQRNIKVNVVVPGAGTAMTATVMPKQLVDAAKPEFVAPMVGFLCSDSPDVPTGRIFEAGCGFYAELQWRRSDGLFLDISKPIQVEDIQRSWVQITDMSKCADPIEEDKKLPKQFRQAVMVAKPKPRL